MYQSCEVVSTIKQHKWLYNSVLNKLNCMHFTRYKGSLHIVMSWCVDVVGGRMDHMRAAEHFIVKYRAGKLGRMTLDSISDLNPH